MGPELLQKGMSLGQVLAVCALSLKEIRDGIQPDAVHAHVEPEVDHPHHCVLHMGVIIIEVRLMRIEAVPVVGSGQGVPGPVGGFKVLEDYSGIFVFFGSITPDIKVSPGRIGLGSSCFLEPGVRIRGVVQHHLGYHPDALLMCFFQESSKGLQITILRMNSEIVGDIIAVISKR